MSVTTDVDARPFSATLRASTLAVHEKANYSTYMRALLGGELTQEGYTQLAVQYYFIYGAIEAASDTMAGHPVGGEFVFDELRRLPNLERDLAHLVGPDWRSAISPLASTQAYVDRIREASSWAGGYVAHHYTRYLGDLSGGQFIGRLMARQFGFETNGIGFYLFSDIADPKAFKEVYREQLDAAPWDAEEQARVIDEVLLAYRFNTELFDDLAAAKQTQVA